MSFSKQYRDRVEAVVTILPLLEETPYFALKGGTAINLFYQDFPRLSVDIDLCYLRIENREKSIIAIADNLKKLKLLIENRLKWKVEQSISSEQALTKLMVHSPLGLVKIEPNYTIRGSVFQPVRMSLSEKAVQILEVDTEVKCLSFEDIYAGKLCAALDRQHPRDLFDVHIFLKNNAFTPTLIKAFIVYLVQSSRPIHELLNPNPIDISKIYENEFQGMTDANVELADLQKIQKILHKTLISNFSNQDKAFLLSFKQGKPSWDNLGIGDYSKLPGVQWKMQNINKMETKKRLKMLTALESILTKVQIKN